MTVPRAETATLNVATGDYAHTRALAAELLQGGHDQAFALRHHTAEPADIFRRALADPPPFDVMEMSLATAYVLAGRGGPRFVALPVFPSRLFRHAAFYVGKAVEIPQDLRGKRIGVIRYGMTAAVWARALLAAEYGVRPEEMTWWIGERQFFQPGGIVLNVAEGAAALEAMLEDGRLDCLFSVHVPKAFREGRVRRLFPDVATAEREAFARTGYVPLMHTVLLRRELAEHHPWLPGALMARFAAARDEALAWLLDTDASTLPLPFQHAWAEEACRVGGGHPWPDGLEANRPALTAFAEAMHGQGLTSRHLTPEEVFPVGG